jgi:biopolymer transport protein ExbD
MGVSIQPSGKGGKKALDAELNLIPFIDLLIVNICFLLITAVWVQMARRRSRTSPRR